MLILNSPQVVQENVMRWRKQDRIALVPTMGGLHEGHLSLIEVAKRFADKVIVSLFVNPLQFGRNEDFDQYPRSFEKDESLLEKSKVDLLFAPSARDLYPDSFSSTVSVKGITEHLCGRSRPGHFDGVATICLKLFQITQPDFAVFGEKDFQQLRMIEQMVADFNLPMSVIGAPIIRDTDGLALSTRNQNLTAEQRVLASQIPQSIQHGIRAFGQNPNLSVGDCLGIVHAHLQSLSNSIDYLEIAPSQTLLPALKNESIAELVMPRLFLAVRVGETRLIDNANLRG